MSKTKKERGGRATGRRWKQWKESDACEVLAQWRQSGLSASEFAARHGYSAKRLQYWCERLGAQPARKTSTVAFVPVAVGDAHHAGHIEIEHRGVVLRVRESLGVEYVARLVAALAGVEPAC